MKITYEYGLINQNKATIVITRYILERQKTYQKPV